MDKTCFVLYFMSLLLMTTSLEIKKLLVPDVVVLENNKSEIFDCDFTTDNDTAGLVLKWFHDDMPVYQWIIGHGPQAIGLFKGKLDLSYQTPENSHHSIRIKELSLEMAGVYKCVVSTYVAEDSKSRRMVIVNRPKELEMQQLESPGDSVSFACTAYGVFPEPVVNISYPGSNAFDDIENQSTKNDDQLYNVTQVVTINKNALEDSTELLCELAIPDTNYTDEKRFKYYKGSVPTTESQPQLIVYNDSASENPSTEDDAETSSVALPWLILLASVTTLLST